MATGVGKKTGHGGRGRGYAVWLGAALSCGVFGNACGVEHRDFDDRAGLGGDESHGGGGAGEAPTTAGDAGAPLGISGTGAGSESSLQLVKIEPADGAEGVEPTTTLRLTFSEPLDEDSVSADSIALWLGDQRADGKLVYADGVVTFEPLHRLSLFGRYRIEVSESLADASGRSLAEAVDSQFRVRDGAWTELLPIQKLEAESGLLNEAAMGIDGEGRALFAWIEGGPSRSALVALRWYTPGSGLSGAEAAFRVPASNHSLRGLRCVVTPEGNAALAWLEDTTEGYQLWVRRYLHGAWEEPEPQLEQLMPSPRFDDPKLAMGGGRTAIGYFVDTTGPAGESALRLHLADDTQSWPQTFAIADRVTVDSGDTLEQSQLRLDGAGNLLVTYNHVQAGVGDVRYVRAAMQPNFVLSAPASIDAKPLASFEPHVTVNESGDAALVYLTGEQRSELMSSRYTKAKGWTAPKRIDELGRPIAFGPASPLATAGEGFLLAWRQPVGSIDNIYASRWSEDGWGAPELVSDGNAGALSFGNAVDRDGNALIVWVPSISGPVDVIYSRAAAHLAWSVPQKLVAPSQDTYEVAQLLAAKNGVVGLAATGVYRVGSGIRPVYASFE